MFAFLFTPAVPENLHQYVIPIALVFLTFLLTRRKYRGETVNIEETRVLRWRDDALSISVKLFDTNKLLLEEQRLRQSAEEERDACRKKKCGCAPAPDLSRL